MSLDDFVFNTEAHPFKAPPASDFYGSGTLVDNGEFKATATAKVPVVSAIAKLNLGSDTGVA